MGVNEEDPALTLTMQKATLIRAKGKKEDMKTLSFFADPRASGDTIDMTFRVEGHRGGTLARQVWRTWMFDRLKIPVTLSRYVLMTPLDLEPRVLTHGTAPQADVKTLGNWRIREWRTEDTPALRKDTGSPAVFDCGSWLEVSTTDSWATIARWYRDLSRPRCEPDAVVRAKAAELTKGLSTPDEKIAALVRFVSRKVAYHSGPLWRSPYIPEEGRFVLQRGAGDCKDKAALLTALLASQGIRAQMALVNPRSEGITRHLPSICFVHAITRIEAPQGPLWVDATDAKADFGYLPDEDQEVPALIADDATTDLVMTPAMPPDRRGLVETHTGTVGSDGSLTATAQIEYLGGEATRTRDWLDEASPDQRDEALRELLTEIAPNARYESGTAADLDALDKPAVLRLSYKVFRHTQDAGDLLLLRPPGLDLYGSTLKAFPADPARKQDLETAKIRGRFVRRVTLGIPAGWAARALPPEVAGTSPWGSYRVTYRVENGTLHVEADARVLPLRVPAADIPRFAEFLSALDHEARRHVLFRKP